MRKVIFIGICVSMTLLLRAQTVTDIDGNIYHSVLIGDQEWLIENLNVSKFRNGDIIPNITDNTAWVNATNTIARCYYNNDSAQYANPYGALYNLVTVIDSRNISPVGWHVATNEEWQTLREYLGGSALAGGHIKESGEVHWAATNLADNTSGFSAVGNGLRKWDGSFSSIGESATWWPSGEKVLMAPFWQAFYNMTSLSGSSINRLDGMGVRCVKDVTSDLKKTESNLRKIKISPNPVGDFIQIAPSNTYNRIEIIDLLGKVKICQNADVLNINVSEIPNGIYILNLINNGLIVHSEKFIKE